MTEMEEYCYYYQVRYYCEGKEFTGKGLVFGDCWATIIEKLVQTYGELEMFAIDKLVAVSDGCSCVEFSEIQYNLKQEEISLSDILKEKIHE